MATFLLAGLQGANAWYSPSQQRWLNRDPLGEPGFDLLTGRVNFQSNQPFSLETEMDGDSPNLYWFVDNRPTTEIDPLGLLLGFGYGNWCGYSRSGQGGNPIDAVDAACQKHDNCLATWADACKFKFCNVKFCRDVAFADCKGDKACRKAKRKIATACILLPLIPPLVVM